MLCIVIIPPPFIIKHSARLRTQTAENIPKLCAVRIGSP